MHAIASASLSLGTGHPPVLAPHLQNARPAAHPHGCALTTARLLSIATVFGLTIGVLVYAAASFSGTFIQHLKRQFPLVVSCV